MVHILTVLFFVVLGAVAYLDLTDKEINDLYSVILYIIAFKISLINSVPLWQIIMWSIIIPTYLVIQELLFQWRRGVKVREITKIDRADISISAAIGALTLDNSLLFVLVTFALVYIAGSTVLKTRDRLIVTPFAMIGLAIMMLKDSLLNLAN